MTRTDSDLKMHTNEESNAAGKHNAKRGLIRLRSKSVRAFLCLGIIFVGFIAANYLIQSAPKANRRPPAKMTPLVEVQAVHPASHAVAIRATGTVIPAQEIILRSRVSGEIVNIHPDFSEGGFLPQGTEILKIDDTDYRLAVAQKLNAVVNARYNLKLELGHQEVAKREWALLNSGKSSQEADGELALRKPHLEKAESDLRAAEAELEQAQLDLDRTAIRAPFDAIVRAAHVEIGSQVAAQESLAELVGTDEYWIKASVPVDHLHWITIPSENHGRGATARIFYRSNAERAGRVIRLLGDLETEGRMARVLISVKDPLGLNAPKNRHAPLLIGEYVRVTIEGQQLHGVYRIPRTALRDNTYVWIAGADSSLDIRQVETLWRDKDTVLLKEGLNPGELLIVSDLSTPVEGMPVNVENPVSKTPPSETQKAMAGQG